VENRVKYDSGGSPPGFALWMFVSWLAVTAMWWALAFAPLPVPPLLLAEARSVCFGTLANGLPDTWGWVGLVLSPLAMLGFLLAVWGRQLLAQLGHLATGRAGRIALVAMLTLPLLGLSWVGRRVAQARQLEVVASGSSLPAELPATYPRGEEAAPAIELVDQTGREVSLAGLQGQTVLLTFAFAHCQTVCPVIVNTVRSAAEELADVAPVSVIVTLDPWRDTPSSLPSIHRSWQLDRIGESHVLSGEVDKVLATLEAWQMPIDRDAATGDISHPPMVFVVAPDGDLAYSFNNPPVEWVVEAARRLVADSRQMAGG
jgi:cytochrome oxidase Cu insertion factor (SCO1/SenC/PrrC family)